MFLHKKKRYLSTSNPNILCVVKRKKARYVYNIRVYSEVIRLNREKVSSIEVNRISDRWWVRIGPITFFVIEKKYIILPKYPINRVKRYNYSNNIIFQSKHRYLYYFSQIGIEWDFFLYWDYNSRKINLLWNIYIFFQNIQIYTGLKLFIFKNKNNNLNNYLNKNFCFSITPNPGQNTQLIAKIFNCVKYTLVYLALFQRILSMFQTKI